MKLTKDDKFMLVKQYSRVYPRDSKMAEYCAKHVSGYMRFPEGLFTMDKPSLETEFWFPEHGWDWDEVKEEVKVARESEEFFKNSNLGNTRAARHLQDMEDGLRTPYLKRSYNGQDDSPFVYVEWLHASQLDGRELRALTPSEIAELREFCEDEQAKFEKRLDTYLKRYGLSKVRCSTFWADR